MSEVNKETAVNKASTFLLMIIVWSDEETATDILSVVGVTR